MQRLQLAEDGRLKIGDFAFARALFSSKKFCKIDTIAFFVCI